MPIYFYLDCCLLFSELALAVRRRSSAQTEKKDAGSLRLLWIVISLAMTAGHFFANFRLGPSLPHIFLWVGTGVFICGTILRWWSIVHLGRFFTVDVALAQDHALVETGPYRRIRHPSYTGLLLQFFGIGLCLKDISGVLVIMLPIWIVLQRRITIEERALEEKLGLRYIDYCKRTGRLFPVFRKSGPARI